MMKLNRMILGLILILPAMASADLVEEITREPASTEESVLDESMMEVGGWNDPIFSSQGLQRDVANSNSNDESTEVDWYGELSVQREIPFTYPVVTRLWLQQKTLNEFEAKKASQ